MSSCFDGFMVSFGKERCEAAAEFAGVSLSDIRVELGCFTPVGSWIGTVSRRSSGKSVELLLRPPNHREMSEKKRNHVLALVRRHRALSPAPSSRCNRESAESLLNGGISSKDGWNVQKSCCMPTGDGGVSIYLDHDE